MTVPPPDRAPDRLHDVAVDGFTVKVYDFGDPADPPLLLLNGGPGLPCDYLRDSHSRLTALGLRVVAFDQLGTGSSDRPEDPALWTIDRYVAEVETVRTALDLEPVHLLGQSWGGWLAIDYALAHPGAVRSLMLANTCANLPFLQSELDRHRAALGPETVAMMLHHEAAGTLDHPEYQAAVTILNYRHVCRLQTWPAPVLRSLNDWNMAPYQAMQGPNEFLYVGNLKDWDREPDLHRITVPAWIGVGRFDEITPACARRMKERLPDAELHVFAASSHMPFFEEPEAWFAALERFLRARLG